MPVPAGSGSGTYADAASFKRRMGIPDSDTTRDADIEDALTAATDAINQWTGRQFNQSSAATERIYASGISGVDTDDFWTTEGLEIGGTAYASTTYALEPVNGTRNGVAGWPYSRITYATYGHPVYVGGLVVTSITVKAQWGWADIPAGVRSACLLLAADELKSADAPFGVAGFGDYVVRVRANPKVAEKLAPYVRTPIMVA